MITSPLKTGKNTDNGDSLMRLRESNVNNRYGIVLDHQIENRRTVIDPIQIESVITTSKNNTNVQLSTKYSEEKFETGNEQNQDFTFDNAIDTLEMKILQPKQMKQLKPSNFVVLDDPKSQKASRNQTIEKSIINLTGPPLRKSMNTSQPFKQRKERQK